MEPEDGDPDRDREGQEAGGTNDGGQEPGSAQDEVAGDDRHEREREAERHPLDLLSLDPLRPAEPQEQRADRREEHHREQQADDGVDDRTLCDEERVRDGDLLDRPRQRRLPEDQRHSDHARNAMIHHRNGRHRGEGRCPSGNTSGRMKITGRIPQKPPEVVHEPQEHDERSGATARHEPREELSREEAGRGEERRVQEHQADHVPAVATDDHGADDAEHRERDDVGHLLGDRFVVHDDEGGTDHGDREEDREHEPRPPGRPGIDAISR